MFVFFFGCVVGQVLLGLAIASLKVASLWLCLFQTSGLHFDFVESRRLFFTEWSDFSEFHTFTLSKLECSKQAYAVNTLAWNNGTGLWSCFVGFEDRSND